MIGFSLERIIGLANAQSTGRTLGAHSSLQGWRDRTLFRERDAAHPFNPLPIALAIVAPNFLLPAGPASSGIRPSFSTGARRERAHPLRAARSPSICDSCFCNVSTRALESARSTPCKTTLSMVTVMRLIPTPESPHRTADDRPSAPPTWLLPSGASCREVFRIPQQEMPHSALCCGCFLLAC